MNLLKNLFPIYLLSLATTFSFQTSTTNTCEKTDTIKFYSTGKNNRIVINSILFNDSLRRHILAPIKGEIKQAGQNNSVDIKTGNKTLKNKNKTENNKKSSTISITQTGKNNNVKINSF